MGSLLHREIYKALKSKEALIIKQSDDYFPVYNILTTENLNFFYPTYTTCKNLWSIDSSLSSLCSLLAQTITKFTKTVHRVDIFKYSVDFQENYCVYIEQDYGKIAVTILIYRLRLFKELLEAFLKSKVFKKIVCNVDFYSDEDTRLLRVIWTYGTFYLIEAIKSANSLDNDEAFSKLEERHPVDFKILRELCRTREDFNREHLLVHPSVREEMFFHVSFHMEYPIS